MGPTTLLYVATLLAVGLVGLQAPTAFALGYGVGCMIKAPSGATVGPLHLGHVGWAFQVGGATTWYYGATENGGGSVYVAPGDDAQTWISSSTSQTDMLNDFKYGGPYDGVGYYTEWRCNTISNSAVDAALTEQQATADSGYNAATDNCLTKAVAILNAYGEGLFYNGDFDPSPNNYFDNLGSISGWGPTHTL